MSEYNTVGDIGLALLLIVIVCFMTANILESKKSKKNKENEE